MKPVTVLLSAAEPQAALFAEMIAALGCRQADNTSSDAEALVLAEGGDIAALSAAQRELPVIAMPSQRRTAEKAGLAVFAVLSTPLFDSLLHSLRRLSAQLPGHYAENNHDIGIVAHSEPMRRLQQLVQQVAAKSVTVMLSGPSGAGKEVVARSIHQLSARSAKAFVPVNCGAIPRELLESELFGHERGAFTGAISSRAGRFELADGGTLFLDEIGDMPLDMQVKILRAIQEKCFERVGSNTTRSADVRIIAATHRDLPAMIAAGEFREDLFYRLNVFPIAVPGLAQRREDIPALVIDISEQLAQDGVGELRLSPAALASLQCHPWSGNVRELANLLERLAIMYNGEMVGFADLPEAYRWKMDDWQQPAIEDVALQRSTPRAKFSAGGIDLKVEVRELEIQRIRESLEYANGVVSQAAKQLGLQRTTLIEKMRKYGLANKC
ncbi:MAG: sigma-54 interaction domain-containing protein [Spongiibacter sp.]